MCSTTTNVGMRTTKDKYSNFVYIRQQMCFNLKDNKLTTILPSGERARGKGDFIN